MAILDTELDLALRSLKTEKILASTVPRLTRENALRALERRHADIAFELASEEARLSQAEKEYYSILGRIEFESKQGWHRTRLTFVALVGILLAIAVAANWLFGWELAIPVFRTWRSPFSAGWYIGLAWFAIYAAVALSALQLWIWYVRRPALRRELAERHSLASVEESRRTAQRARIDRLAEIVRFHVTEIINSGRKPRFAPVIQVDHALADGSDVRALTIGIGLSETFTAGNEIPTDTRNKVLHRLETLPGGSIGISGPRGVGKSTLIASICETNIPVGGRPAITVATAAPVEYQARDFLLHLFSALCQRVFETEGVGREESEALDEIEVAQWRQKAWRDNVLPISRLLIVIGLPFLAIAIGISLSNPAAPVPDRADLMKQAAAGFGLGLTPGPFAMLGVLALVLGLVIYFSVGSGLFRHFLFPQRRRIDVPNRSNELVDRAREELRKIRFQRSFTSGWSGAIKASAGVELGATSSLTLQQQTESLPELVARFRAFVQTVAGEHGHVIFGIDELDKLKSAHDAEAFLNGIKSVFGIPRCFYLISVSEHALASFERRGIGFRDAFDSALDDVLQMRFLTLPDTRLLIDRRILRLPDPFLQVCHMFSGGLPRDLVRHARRLLDFAAEQSGQPLGLTSATETMLTDDLRAKVRATSIAIRNAKELIETSAVLTRIAELPIDAPVEELETKLILLHTFLANLKLSEKEEGRHLAKLAEELVVYGQIMVQLRRVADLLATNAGWKSASKLGLAEEVAGARQALEVGVPLAQARLDVLKLRIDEATNAISKIPTELSPAQKSGQAASRKPRRKRATGGA